jgi:hypothetical protein
VELKRPVDSLALEQVVSLCAALDGLGGAYANWMPQYYNTQLNFNLQSSVRTYTHSCTRIF